MTGAVRVERRARVLSITAGFAAVVATALLVAWARPPAPPATAVERPPSRAEVTPSTVPPLDAPSTTVAPVPSTVAGATDPSTTESASPSTTSPGLADLLPPIERGAAIAEDRTQRAAPVGVENTVFDSTRYPIRPIGLEDDGQLEIPDETEIGWYRYGATAGAPGATVLAAHVSWNNRTGPFFELPEMDPGDRISVSLDDGTARHYEVVERTVYEKDQLPRERIWRTTGPETLVLITCGGDFNPEIRRYRHNVVVYAVPVG